MQRELAAERDQLAGAVDTFRGETETLVARVKRRLPFVAAIGVALGVAVAFVRRGR